MSLRKGSFHSPRVNSVKRYKTLQKQQRYKKSKISDLVRYCSWRGENGQWAADVVIKSNGRSRRKTIGYFKKESDALDARIQYYQDLEKRKSYAQHRKEFPELYKNNNSSSIRNKSKTERNNEFHNNKTIEPPIAISPRAVLRMGLSPRASLHNARRDSHTMVNLPQGYRDSTHGKQDLENLNFKRFHRNRHGNNIIPDMMKAEVHRTTVEKWTNRGNKGNIQQGEPYYPLYRRESNNINLHLMERHQKLLRERTVTKAYNNVFRRQHAWHPHTFKMREKIERHHGHEGEINDTSVPSKHKNYVRNHSHVNIFKPNEVQDHEIYHENLIRKMKGQKLLLGDTRVIHPHSPHGPPTPPTAWPNGANRSGRIDYEKLRGYN
jgi:hypothetical protein